MKSQYLHSLLLIILHQLLLTVFLCCEFWLHLKTLHPGAGLCILVHALPAAGAPSFFGTWPSALRNPASGTLPLFPELYFSGVSLLRQETCFVPSTDTHTDDTGELSQSLPV